MHLQVSSLKQIIFYGAGFGCWSGDTIAACLDSKFYFGHTNTGKIKVSQWYLAQECDATVML